MPNDPPTDERLWSERMLTHWRGSAAPAIVDDDGVVTGDGLLRLAAGASARLDDLGLAPGDVVPALVDESRAAIALVVAGGLTRRPVAPLGTKLNADELADAVRRLGARHLVVAPERVEFGQRVAAAADVTLVMLDAAEGDPDAVEGPTEPDDVVVIVHTSGTTGSPQAVLLRQRPLAARVDVYEAVMGIGPGDRYSSASPFHHTAGVAMDVTVLPMGVAIIPQDWFSVDNWRRSGRLGATCTLLVPTMIDLLLAAGALADVHPRVLQYGAMPIHPDTLRAAMDALPDTRFLQIFGQTEASPLTYLDHDDHRRAAAGRADVLLSVGRPVPGLELRIERADDEADDGIGEVAVRAAHTFVHDADGWRRTGDLGVVDDDGYVTLRGRVNDRIIRGGENIYPVEIELALVAHPGVRDAAVVGVADRRWGEIVKAVVVPTDASSPPDVDELRRFLAGRLAHFKLPTVFEMTDELPRNASGKVLRRLLR